jgi:polyhydroxyalkanoate synthesis regulator phasin
MPLTKHEKQEIVDEVYKKLQPELENFKNNVSTQIKSIYSELINNSVDAKTNYSKLDKKLDNLLFTLVGNDLDNENSLFARFKRVESFLNIINV